MIRPFPLVADGQPVGSQARSMNLYDNEDLISNIKGAYQDKVYQDSSEETFPVTEQGLALPSQQLVGSGFEPAEKARQEAKADVKKKRQAMVTAVDKQTAQRRHLTGTPVSKSVSQENNTNSWSKYAQALRQDDYILAELPQVYTEPNNPPSAEKGKNNYDFLKRSQIYNPELRKGQTDRTKSQELNLSRFEDSK